MSRAPMRGKGATAGLPKFDKIDKNVVKRYFPDRKNIFENIEK